MRVSLPLQGGCACGAVRYECSAQPLLMFICHCRDCQHATGGACAPNILFSAQFIKFTKGEPQSHGSKASSGQLSYRDFCHECGSPIGMRSDAYPEIRILRAGSFDDPQGFEPTANIWMCNAIPWDTPDLSLPQADQNMSSDEIAALAAKIST